MRRKGASARGKTALTALLSSATPVKKAPTRRGVLPADSGSSIIALVSNAPAVASKPPVDTRRSCFPVGDPNNLVSTLLLVTANAPPRSKSPVPNPNVACVAVSCNNTPVGIGVNLDTGTRGGNSLRKRWSCC